MEMLTIFNYRTGFVRIIGEKPVQKSVFYSKRSQIYVINITAKRKVVLINLIKIATT